MGTTGGDLTHADGYLKFRWGWSDPRVSTPDRRTEDVHLEPAETSPGNALIVRPDPVGHPDEFFYLEVRNGAAVRWDGNHLEFDQQLAPEFQGLLIYRINAIDPSAEFSFIRLESDSSDSVAFAMGARFGPPSSNFSDGTPSGLTVEVTRTSGLSVDLRLTWSVNVGSAELYRSLMNGPDLLHSFSGWRDSWTTMTSGRLADQSSVLLMNDRTAGEAELHQIDAFGRLNRLARYTGWRKTWGVLLLDDFGSGDCRDLLLYDPTSGEAEFHSFGSDGSMTRSASYSGWRKTWSTMTSLRLGNGDPGLLLYDKSDGHAELHAVSIGKMSLVSSFQGWRTSWKAMVALEPRASGSLILLYDAEHGHAEIIEIEQNSQLRLLAQHDGWRKSWTHLIPGRYTTADIDVRQEVLLYDRAAGHAEIMRVLPGGDVSRTLHFDNWRRTWRSVVATQLVQNQPDTVLFYQASADDAPL